MRSNVRCFVVPAVMVAAGLVAALGCGTPTENPDGGQGGVLFAGDFANYRTWQKYELDSPFDGGNVHSSGHRTEYINKLPPHGSTSFPDGTIIVKELDTDQLTFAMNKRGGNYNASGAVGWEWFELATDAGVQIRWRGFGPPAGETYGGDPTVCNSCHVSALNDAVPSPALQLGNF